MALLGMLTGIVGWCCAQPYYNTSIPNALVQENSFFKQEPNFVRPPAFEALKAKLPEPIWPARADVIKCYWRTWELAFGNLHGVTKANRFISPFIDPAFNGHIFMWDTTFMTMFGRYGHRAFNFQGSLDNFYAHQHKDGYICREISQTDGAEIFEKYDVSSTGPNIMPWAEWEYYQNFKDTERLKKVFPVLLAYYQWFATYRSWPDGSYYSSGWGCGMDNQPRVPAGLSPDFSHGHMSWIDTSLQQLLAGKILLKMAAVLHRDQDVKSVAAEINTLSVFLKTKMWDDSKAYFFDRFKDGSLSDVKSIAAYWALIAQAVPQDGLKPFIAHLENPAEFARTHRVPTLSADHPAYAADGNYWCGGVWAPTSYMVLRGLTAYGQDSLAHAIGYNHLDNVVKVFNETGILWENYAPDGVKGMYRKNMVGWTGLVPISVLFEYVMGIRADVPANTLVWDVRLTDAHGIRNYPFGRDGMVNLSCENRTKNSEKPKIKVTSNVPLTLKMIWAGGTQNIKLPQQLHNKID